MPARIAPIACASGIASNDITARLIAEPLARDLGVRLIIDNRSGASGNIGMEAAARAAPDGYTVVLNTIPLVTNQSLFEKLTWDPMRDFAPIGMVATSPHVLVVPAKVPVKNVDELVRLAKSSPGKLSYASAGVGTTFHLCGEMFKDSTGTFILHVPYRGGGAALLDTLAAQVQWLALLAPAKTPPAVVDRLNAALKNALNTPEVKDKFQAQAFEAFITTPEEARKYLAAEVQRFSRLIKARGITAN